MQKKTHVLAAVALSTIILNPSSVKLSLLTITASTIGALLPDIDVSTSDSHKDVTIITIVSILTIIGTFLIDYYLNLGLISYIFKNKNILLDILYFLIFILLCAHGLHTNHRTFMHSFLAAFLFTTLVFLTINKAFLPFLIAYLSHIFLDIFNKKKVQLFYPLKCKFCLDLCESDGIINYMLSILSIIFIIVFK